MNGGCRELARALTAYLACLAFVLAFFVALLTGGSVLTAVVRGAVVVAVTLFLGSALVRPLISTILDAMARDRSDSSEQPGDTA